ncbi:MAG: pyridoxal phosphate-dependent class II aminotransferase [Methanocorpusculum sp.]|nr:pyridoxal phosphate-dependent class II aminotransferase [Methanocorpusculum sp.]
MPSEFPKKVVHGGKIQEMRRIFGESLLDVSASMNPFVPEFSCAYNHEDLAVYPDDSYTALKEKISSVFGRDTEEICVGNGSAEIIRVFCKVTDGKTCRIDMPTFGEYGLSARLAGKTVVQNTDADIRFLCNPNNPTGILTPRAEMLQYAEEAEDAGSLLFVDEAFMELAERDESISDIRLENLFVMRSITKCFTVPGIRFGFAFGEPELIEKIETARTPWTVNAFAECYAMAAFDHYAELKESAAKITEERNWYMQELEKLGVSCYPSQVNYITIDTGREASAVRDAMLSHGILVRDCTSFTLPTCIRVSVETREKNHRVLEALAECLR